MRRVINISDELTVTTKLRCIELAKEIKKDSKKPSEIFNYAKDLAEWCLDPSVGVFASFFPTKRKNTRPTKTNKR